MEQYRNQSMLMTNIQSINRSVAVAVRICLEAVATLAAGYVLYFDDLNLLSQVAAAVPVSFKDIIQRMKTTTPDIFPFVKLAQFMLNAICTP